METRWSPGALHIFELFFRPWMRRRLAGIYVMGLPAELPRDRAVVLAANHVSWWDGFLLRELHRQSGTRAPLFTLMREDRLRRIPFFRWLGVVGLRPKSAGSVLHALHFLRARRRRYPGCWLAMFPQGRIWPSWRRPLGMQPGLAAFARVLAPATVLPVGLHLEPLNDHRLAAFVSVGTPLAVEEGAPLALDEVERGIAAALERTYALLARHGEATPRHWPGDSGALSTIGPGDGEDASATRHAVHAFDPYSEP